MESNSSPVPPVIADMPLRGSKLRSPEVLRPNQKKQEESKHLLKKLYPGEPIMAFLSAFFSGKQGISLKNLSLRRSRIIKNVAVDCKLCAYVLTERGVSTNLADLSSAKACMACASFGLL